MAVSRSPNYPAIDLESALNALKAAYEADGRSKMARSVLAHHLGYTSLNGRALAKIGAIRAYGFIEGREDELRISQDAIICIEAPDGSPELAEAILRCANNPPIFKEITSEYPGLPSEQNLRFFLIKKGFSPDAAAKAAKNYLSTMRFAEEIANEGDVGSPLATSKAEGVSEEDIVLKKNIEPAVANLAIGRIVPPIRTEAGEREYLRGSLSKDVTYRLIIDGELGPKQIGKLIKLLEAQKAVLDDDENDAS